MNAPLNIGIDLDNTIINYQGLFAQAACAQGWSNDATQSKDAIKHHLLNTDGNDQRWRVLQTQVYAHLIASAKPFDGLIPFCQAVRQQGDRIYIVSHKTPVSNLDACTNLITPAKAWLQQQPIDPDGLFFCATREAKIRQIAQLNCTLFIDDLSLILADKTFPKHTYPLLFAPHTSHSPLPQAASWAHISTIYQCLKHYGLTLLDTLFERKHMLPTQLQHLHGGNHTVSSVTFADNTQWVIKSGKPDRIKRDAQALSLLSSHHIKPIPQLIAHTPNGHLISTHLSGTPITSVSRQHIHQVVDFIRRLDTLSRSQQPAVVHFPAAAQARTNLQDYLDGIDTRLTDLTQGVRQCEAQYAGFTPLRHLIEDSLPPLKQAVFAHFAHTSEAYGWDNNAPFAAQERILSPSDLGFHNTLISPKQTVQFLDFEYFGWDDKAKLCCDFLHHQGHHLSNAQKQYFLTTLHTQGVLTDALIQRIHAVLDVVGFEWILIVLNIAQPHKTAQKIHANASTPIATLVQRQGDQAEQLVRAFTHRQQRQQTYLSASLTDVRHIL